MSLTACGGGATNHEVDQNLPDGYPKSEKQILFWHCLGQEKRNNLLRIVNQFNAQYAGKYNVVLDALAGDYSSLSSDVMTKLQAGTVPAMTMGYPDTFADLITNNIKHSAILRLNNFISDPNYGFTQDELDDFVPAYYAEGSNYQFEGTWSMPMYKSTEVMYYNRSFFSGVNDMNDVKFAGNSEYNTLRALCTDIYDDDIFDNLNNLKTWVAAHDGYTYDVPESWQDLFELAQQIKTDYANKPTGFVPVGYDSDSNLMITQLEQRGFAYTTNENVKKEADHFQFNNQNTINLVTEITNLINNKLLVTKNTNGNSYTSDLFTAGKCLMSIGSTGGSTYQKSTTFVVGLAPVPAFRDTSGVLHKKYIQQGPSVCFFDNQDPQIHKGAWLFYKMMAEPENNATLALDNSYDPIRISSYTTDYYRGFIAKANQNLGLQYDIPYITNQLKDNYMTSPVFKGSATARDEIGNIITYVVRMGYSVTESVRRAYNACY